MARVCSITQCEREHYARGWCDAHYKRWRKQGTAGSTPIKPKYGPICRVEGCNTPILAHGWCRLHHDRWKRHGDPLMVLQIQGSGDNVAYDAAHRRVRALWGPASQHPCISCGLDALHWAYDHTDPNERHTPEGYSYSTDPQYYMPMCVSCHKRLDLGRAA